MDSEYDDDELIRSGQPVPVGNSNSILFIVRGVVMQGFRTILVAIFGPFVLWGAKVLAAKGFNLTPEQEQTLTEYLVGGGMTVAMIVMRFLTTTPVFKKAEKLLGTVAAAPAPTPATTASTTAKLIPLLLIAGFVLASGSLLTGCAVMDKIGKDITSPAAQPYVTDGALAAVIIAESRGVTAAQINQVAKAVLAADTGASASLAALAGVAQAQIAKLKLPQADIGVIQVVLSAFDTAIQARISSLSAANAASVANTQAAVADVVKAVIAATGG